MQVDTENHTMGSLLFDQISSLVDLTSNEAQDPVNDGLFTPFDSPPSGSAMNSSSRCMPVGESSKLFRPQTLRRRRGKQACVPCQVRKVRCNVAEGGLCANCRWHNVKVVISNG